MIPHRRLIVIVCGCKLIRYLAVGISLISVIGMPLSSFPRREVLGLDSWDGEESSMADNREEEGREEEIEERHEDASCERGRGWVERAESWITNECS